MMDVNKFGVGDIVKIRDEETLARVVMPIQDDDWWWYEVEAIGIGPAMHREVREDWLKEATA